LKLPTSESSDFIYSLGSIAVLNFRIEKVLLLLVVTLVTYWTSNLYAADIHRVEPESDGQVFIAVIEGEIVRGDYDAFTKVIRDNGAHIQYVGIISPGGDFDEAMKIGRAIRALKLVTAGPNQYGDQPPLSPLGIHTVQDQKNIVCANAGFFIYVGGVGRVPSTLMVHHPSFNSDDFGKLSEAEAKLAYDKLVSRSSAYMDEMDVPKGIQECVMNTPGDTIATIDPTLASGLFGDLPYREEWLNAKYPLLSKKDDAALDVLRERIISIDPGGYRQAFERGDQKSIKDLWDRVVAALSEEERSSFNMLSDRKSALEKARRDGEDQERVDAYKKFFGFDPNDLVDYEFTLWISSHEYIGRQFQDILNQEKFEEDAITPEFRSLHHYGTATTPSVMLFGDKDHPRTVVCVSVLSHPRPSRAFIDAIKSQLTKRYGPEHVDQKVNESVWLSDGYILCLKENPTSSTGPFLSLNIRHEQP
jgi:hypothetical protein